MILAAVIFFSIMMLLYLFPPKKINSFYGYRTFSSKKSLKHWEIANKASSKIMMITAGIMLIEAVLLTIYWDGNYELITLITFVIGLAITFFITERKIRRL